MQTLSLFNDLPEENEGKPDRIKALVPRFIDYVVWHDGEKGEAKLEVALFRAMILLARHLGLRFPKPPKPSRMAELAQLWKKATRLGQPDRKAFFQRHMGRIPSRAYMHKIAQLATRNGRLY